jgi:hypothetical protein
MKDYIIAFFVVLAISCFLNGGGMPQSLPVGIVGVTDVTSGAKRADGQIPELNYTDASANATQLTKIDDSDHRESSHSQNGSNF